MAALWRYMMRILTRWLPYTVITTPRFMVPIVYRLLPKRKGLGLYTRYSVPVTSNPRAAGPWG